MEAGKRRNWTGNVYDWYRSTTIPPGLPDSTEAPGVRARLLARLNEAEDFHHRWLTGYKHPTKTWAIYSTGLETDMSILFDPPTRPPAHYESRRDRDVRIETPWPNRGARMQRPRPGDGTVPGTSGAALFPD